MKWQKDNSISVEKARGLEKAELEGKIVIGVLVDREIPTYHEKYRKLFHEKVKV